jgi:hypothetical protein
MTNELYHYGIRGMRWGIRRYQNKDGSLTPAGEKRLNDYKSKETERITKKYQVDKLSVKRNKLENEFIEKNDTHSLNKLTRARYKLLKAQTMEFLEKRKLNSMTYDEMMAERKEIRKQKAKNLLSELESTVLGSISGSDVTKTNMRVSLEESIYSEYEARQNTGYKGL